MRLKIPADHNLATVIIAHTHIYTIHKHYPVRPKNPVKTANDYQLTRLFYFRKLFFGLCPSSNISKKVSETAFYIDTE
jgi:adenosine deaminase